MAIATSDLKFRYSVKTGAAGNTTAGTPAGSLGKWVSTTNVAAAPNALWDDVSAAENQAGDVEYRAVFFVNTHATLTLSSIRVWVSADTAGGSDIDIALDNIAASALGSASPQAAEIADEGTAPSGVGAFSRPTTKVTGLNLGDLAAGQCRAVWIRRTVIPTPGGQADGFTLRAEGSSPP